MGRELGRRGYRIGRLKGKESDEASGGRSDLSPEEIESSSQRLSDLSLSTPGGRDRPAKQGLGS